MLITTIFVVIRFSPILTFLKKIQKLKNAVLEGKVLTDKCVALFSS